MDFGKISCYRAGGNYGLDIEGKENNLSVIAGLKIEKDKVLAYFEKFEKKSV